jgi:hypothetical protein
MAKAVHVSDITALLLSDGWHSVQPGSFNLAPYAIVDGTPEDNDLAIKQMPGTNGITRAGWYCQEQQGFVLCGPLTAIVALRGSKMTDEKSIE